MIFQLQQVKKKKQFVLKDKELIGGEGCLEEKREGGEGGSFFRFTETIPGVIKNTFHLQSTFRTDTLNGDCSVSTTFY